MRQLVMGAVMAGAAAFGVGGVQPDAAQADGYHHGHYGGGFGSYYGRGGHDVQPHWHDTYTPFGRYQWYGRGSHDYRPHHHTYGPDHYEGHSYSPWGYTRSYYPRYPYYYAPW